MKKLIKLIGLNLAVLLILLVLVEITLRIFNIGYGNAPLENDRELHHIHPANYSYYSYDPNKEYGGHRVTYGSDRCRVSENSQYDKSKSDIWFLGDSFTETTQVSWNNSYVGRLDSLWGKKYNCINMGVASYSPLLHYIALTKALKNRKKPECVIIQIYSNDYSDDDAYSKLTKYNGKEPVACDGGENSLAVSLMRESYLVRMLRKLQLTYQFVRKQREKSNNIKLIKTENHVEEYNDDLSRPSNFSQNMGLINDLLTSSQIPHYFLAVPSKYSAMTGDWEINTFSKNFKTYCLEKNYPYIDCDSMFRKWSGTTRLFYKDDIHCNEKGNEQLALSIYQQVKTPL